MLIAGVLLTAFGLGLTATGAALMVAEASQRDGRYAYTDTDRVQTVGHAITTAPLTVHVDEGATVGTFGLDDLIRFELRATSVVPDQDVFIGIADASDVSAYLSDVPHAMFGDDPWDTGYTVDTPMKWRSVSGTDTVLDEVSGTRAPEPPAEQDFWAQSATGADQQSITVELQSGDWVVVVMNADGTRPVWVDVQVGAHTELFGLANPGVLVTGIVALVLGLPLILLGAAGLGRDIDRGPGASGPGVGAAGVGSAGAGAHGAGAGPDPLRLTGHLDPQVSRAMWLIKWLLAIPHYIVMALLWFALVVTTIAAGLTVLFTGRYPRAWFMYSVGVLRWNWRVGFYAYSALGTDRYPPFSLAPADYPAGLDVAYPEQLSRGLVLVKWWLLVIPHLLIVGILTGGGAALSNSSENGGASWNISLVGLLVLIAAIGLLFTGRYLPGLFNLIVGLNRWVYRVGSYVLLLRDEYPPFRLDQGPEEPIDMGAGGPGDAGSAMGPDDAPPEQSTAGERPRN
ncbi:MAG: DUF4389 domain-containing protein [Dietzia sp.]